MILPNTDVGDVSPDESRKYKTLPYVGAPVLVGELNPYGADPYFALYPYPRYSSGGRLCYDILGFDYNQDYLRKFRRVNLCAGHWSMGEARATVTELRKEGGPFITLGAKVARAFRVHFVPFTVQASIDDINADVYVMPHPSGLNRLWNVSGSIDKAREFLKEFL